MHRRAISRWTVIAALCAMFSLYAPGPARATVLSDFFGGAEGIQALDIRLDGTIVAAGSWDCGGSIFGCAMQRDFAVARYRDSGILDSSFSADGFTTVDFGGRDEATAVTTLADGKTVLAGSTPSCGPCPQDIAIARLNADGSPDTTFGTGGRAKATFEGILSQIVIRPDGRLLATGTVWQGGSDFLIASYNADGSPDTTFSGDGVARTDFGDHENSAAAAAYPDGRIIVAGSAGNGCPEGGTCVRDIALARYTPQGNLDPSFSFDGRTTMDFGGSAEAIGVALRPDGRVLVIGDQSCPSCERSVAVGSLTAGGEPDGAFGNNGRRVVNFGTEADPTSYALLGDGAVVVAGSVGPRFEDRDFGLVRLTADGEKDPTFGTGGIVRTDLGADDVLLALRADGAGRLLAGGITSPYCEDDSCKADFALLRYSPAGVIDASFPPPPSPPPVPVAVPAPAPLPAGRVTFKVSPARDLHAPYRFTVKGTLKLPVGITKAQGCSGRVQVNLLAGKFTVAHARAGVTKKQCSFTAKFVVKTRARLRGASRLKLQISFLGNARVGASATASTRLTVRRP